MVKPRPSTFLAEFAHTQLHSARAITDRVNREGLGSEATIWNVALSCIKKYRGRNTMTPFWQLHIAESLVFVLKIYNTATENATLLQ